MSIFSYNRVPILFVLRKGVVICI